jgi:hypothetical protein
MIKGDNKCKKIPNILKTLDILYSAKNLDLNKISKLKDLDKATLKKEIVALELN